MAKRILAMLIAFLYSIVCAILGPTIQNQIFEFGIRQILSLDGGHVGIDLGLNGSLLVTLGLLQFAEEGAVGLGESVALAAQFAGLGDGGTGLLIQLDDLVNQGQLGILELLFNVFFDDFGVFTNKFDIKHG